MTDFISSACVGVTQVAVGHPFNTTLTLIQNNRKWLGLSPQSYYRGWRYPLFSAIVSNMTTFPITERSRKYTGNIMLSGALAGFCVAPLVFCMDLGKIRAQTEQKMHLRNFHTNSGKLSILVRETIALSSYFTTYEFMRDSGYNILVSGATAGLANWSMTYPIQVVKNRQLAQNINIRTAIRQGNLWKGYSVCAARAMIVNAVSFWTYETVKQLLS